MRWQTHLGQIHPEMLHKPGLCDGPMGCIHEEWPRGVLAASQIVHHCLHRREGQACPTNNYICVPSELVSL